MVLYFGLSDYLLVVYLVPGTTFVEKKNLQLEYFMYGRADNNVGLQSGSLLV